MHARHVKLAPAFCLILPLVLATGCGGDRTDHEAPVTTTSPAGESTAPSSAVAERRDTALVRVVHAIPAGKPVDVYADDSRVFEQVNFRDVTPYRELDGQRYVFNIYPAGTEVAPGTVTGTMGRDDTPAGTAARPGTARGTTGAPRSLASNREGLSDGDYYTIFALPGEGNNPAMLRVVEDRHQRPEDNRARVRVVNAAVGIDEIDIYAQGVNDALVGGVDFQTVSNYSNIDPHTGSLEIRAHGQTAPVTNIADVRIEAGKSYTVVVVGNQRRAPRLEAFVIEDVIGPGTAEPGRTMAPDRRP